MAGVAEQTGEDQVVTYKGGELTIGRSNVNEVVLDDPGVSRFHATVVASGGELELRDLGSDSGTRLDGRSVTRAVIDDGSLIEVGPYRLRFDGSRFASDNERATLRLKAKGVSETREGKQILKPVSLEVAPGELVAVIGESGSGKTTLLRALAGVTRPTTGTVTLNDDPVTTRVTDLGYVPQDEIVHPLLSVEEALGYAARLRLPESGEREVAATVDRVLAELSLEEHRRTRIGNLSGGQRKRVGVGSELVNRPSLLFLDEPTTGLDPALEGQMMDLFRYLARPAARGVVLVTHATRSLAVCDTLIVLARGGQLCFIGSPPDALEFFGVRSHDEIYSALETLSPEEWHAKLEQIRGRESEGGTGEAAPESASAAPSRTKGTGLGQMAVLSGRYLKLFVRDQRNALILFGQVPLIGLGIALLFKAGLFKPPGRGPEAVLPGRPRDAIQLLFLLVTTAIWFGSIDASREIVKERAVSAREAAVGVRWSAYLSSKAAVLFGVSALQTLALAYFVFAIHPLDEPVSTYLVVSVILLLSAWAAVGVGLAISAAASTEDQATSVIPLTLIPQLLFAGAIVPIDRMADSIALLSNLAFSRWALAGVGSAVGMQDRIDVDKSFSRVGGYGDTFFTVPTGQTVGLLIVFGAIFFTIASVLVVGRRER